MSALQSLVVLVGFASLVFGAPLSLGITLGEEADALPTITLPYATYQASEYDSNADIYYWKNIRFAAPPLGDLRWAKPAAPLTEDGVQDGSVGNQCYQALPSLLSFAYPILSSLEPSSEDCLFIDVKVPGKAVRGEAKDLPVMQWIFGGGYVLGSKSFLIYDGEPLIESADNNIIWVAANYRLGAFGFLGGPTVESTALANAAFWDQRAAFQWTIDYISLFGGDPTQLTAIGESAGAGSIMHHLVAEGGTLEPQFQRAIMMSPAFEPKFDPGVLETQFAAFANAAGCAEDRTVECLRQQTSTTLQDANLEIVESSTYGTFGFGPTVDNDYIRDLPQLEMTNGNYWKGVEVIIGHTADEGVIFANPSIVFNDQFNDLIKLELPNMTAETQAALNELYPDPSLTGEYQTNFERLTHLIGEWVVTCNNKAIAAAYAGSVYGYQYSFPPAIHGTDLIALFFQNDIDFGQYIDIVIDIPLLTSQNLPQAYQSYLTSFVRSGDPNKYRANNTIPYTTDWPQASIAESVTVLDINLDGFDVISDPDTPTDRCDFWLSGEWTGR